MKVLILGGSGFVSGTMARCALRDGHEVAVVTRGTKPPPAGAQSIVVDRKDRPAFVSAIAATSSTWDLVIDCIGYSAEDAQQDLEIFAKRARHLIFLSSDFAMSPVNRPWKIDETYAHFNDTPYGVGKRAAEQILLNWARENIQRESENASQMQAEKMGDGGMRVTVLRPCHIYGPNSLLGCIPAHSRDPGLLDHIKRGEPVALVGGGFFLQQPVFAEDLWSMASSCVGKVHTHGQLYFAAGPEIVQSRDFYQIIADILGVNIAIREIPIEPYLAEHPEHGSFCSHRVYSRSKAQEHGLKLPETKLADGLRKHVESIEQNP